MARIAKVYVERRKVLDLRERFEVKRVIGTNRHLPGDILHMEDIESLLRMRDRFEVIIDKGFVD